MSRGKNTAVTHKGTGQTCSTNTTTTEKPWLTRNDSVTSLRVEALTGKNACPKQDDEHTAATICIHILPGDNWHGIPTVLPSESLDTLKYSGLISSAEHSC